MNRQILACCLSLVTPCLSGRLCNADGLKKVPADTVCVVSIDVDQIKNSKGLNQLPWQNLQGSSLASLGVDLTQLSRVDASVGIENQDTQAFSIELTSSEPLDLESLKVPNLGPVGISRRDETLRFRKFNDSPIVVAQVSPTYSLVGTQKRLIEIWRQTESDHPLVSLTEETNSPVRLVVDVAAVKQVLMDGLDKTAQATQREGMEELIQKVRSILENTQYLRIDLTAESSIGCTVELLPENGSEIGKLEGDVRWLVEGYLPDLIQKVGPQLEMALRQANAGGGESKQFQVRSEDNRVKIEGAAPFTSFAIAAGLILPAIQTVRNKGLNN